MPAKHFSLLLLKSTSTVRLIEMGRGGILGDRCEIMTISNINIFFGRGKTPLAIFATSTATYKPRNPISKR